MRSTLASSKHRQRKQGNLFIVFSDCRLPTKKFIAFVNTKANFSPTHHSHRFGLQPELQGVSKLAFSDPTQFKKIESKKSTLSANSTLTVCFLSSYVVLSQTSSLVCDSASMCCIHNALSFSPTGKRSCIPKDIAE